MFEIGRSIKGDFNFKQAYTLKKGVWGCGVGCGIIIYLEKATKLKIIPKKQMETEVNRL